MELVMMTAKNLAATLMGCLAVGLAVGAMTLQSEREVAHQADAHDDVSSSYASHAQALCQDKCDVQTVLYAMSDRR
jgi:hypothetical protein